MFLMIVLIRYIMKKAVVYSRSHAVVFMQLWIWTTGSGADTILVKGRIIVQWMESMEIQKRYMLSTRHLLLSHHRYFVIAGFLYLYYHYESVAVPNPG